MKTNNRLSKDNNTHEPKVRPMVKVVQHEVWVQFDYEKGKMELRWFEDTNYYYKKDRATGNTREVERPMNDTEYIEYLEKENQELKEHNINQRKAFAILLNEEEDKYKKEFRELNDKLLKVVEDVIFEHQPRTEDFNDIVYCECGKDDFSYRKHLLQEIKSAIEKGNND